MSAPYWGQLPGPKIAQAHHRRNSETDDYGYNNADRRQSLEIPPVRKNRASVQTTHSQAPTESTFSPYEESPTASNFAPEGLAPRPASYKHTGHRDVASDSYDRRSRRRSRNLEEFDDDDALSPSLPTAPEVPRGPPVSYRHPYGNGGLPYTVASSGSAAPPPTSNPPAPDDDMDADYYYSRASGRNESQDHGSAPADHRRVPSGTSGRRKKFANDRSPLQRLELTLDSITKEEKRARVEAAEQRARNRAALRSGQPAPMQTAPEQPPPEQQVRFHERKPSNSHGKQRVTAADAVAVAASMPPVARQPPRDEPRETYVEPHREKVRETPREAPREAHRESYGEAPRESHRESYREPPREIPREAPREAPVYRQDSNRHRGPLTQHPPEETHHYGLLPEEEVEEPLPATRHVEADSGIPKRNLSFRERAARDNVQFDAAPRQSLDEQPPSAAPSGGFSLTRSGSNKLKKQPPAEYQYTEPAKKKKTAVEAEFHDLAEQPRNAKPQADYRYAVPEKKKKTAVEAEFHDLPEQARNAQSNDDYYVPRERGPSLDVRRQRQPPMDTSTRAYGTSGRDYPEYMPDESQAVRRRATEPVPRHEYDSEEEEEEYAAPPPKAKFFGLGRKLSQKEPPKGKQVQKEEDRQDAAASKRRARRADSFSSESSHDHHVSNMVFKRREDMSPGNGLYKPPKFLDEWKKATVGTLGGTLLDVHESHAAPPDPGNKAWWEKEGRRGNHPYGARPRKAEAFDGEYDENGESISILITGIVLTVNSSDSL